MVKVIGYQEPSLGKKHNRLILQGEIEMIQSQREKKIYYATIQTCTVSCTFNSVLCDGLVGKTLPGTIEKMECLPYEFKAPNSDEILLLDFTYYYNPSPKTMEQAVFTRKATSVNTSNVA
ncbi:hypothetical protein [Adhaeribacter terreus]|uniref:Uncharacterized protein n=1 Tax=Adhaeribacter terreus TaxID=529703 RepID=A0ABW0EBY8_9BACT